MDVDYLGTLVFHARKGSLESPVFHILFLKLMHVSMKLNAQYMRQQAS